MTVKLVWHTEHAEKLIAYCARVSNPENQENEDISGLLKYCVKHGHWSILEMANMCVEITTSRAISAQILRHRSFTFQEFSQRYAETQNIQPIEVRRQDVKNRQNSIDDLPEDVIKGFNAEWWYIQTQIQNLYKRALYFGVAKECARMVLPMATQTKLYMNGTLRSWVHYFSLRCDVATQLEHRVIALEAREVFKQEFPLLAEILEY